MSDMRFGRAKDFILTHARLLERRLFEVYFEEGEPAAVVRALRAYQNADGGLGHALEPDLRCAGSQPLFAEVGLQALHDAGCRDMALAQPLCGWLAKVADAHGFVPPLLETALRAPHAAHWGEGGLVPDLNPTVGICGLLHYQSAAHRWLERASEACIRALIEDPPAEAHTLLGATRLADHLPDRAVGERVRQAIAEALPGAAFFIASAPVSGYGLTPLHFAPVPDSPWRGLFTDAQIQAHLDDLERRQEADGGWPIAWQAPGAASEAEWRGRWALEALRTLVAYGRILVD